MAHEPRMASSREPATTGRDGLSSTLTPLGSSRKRCRLLIETDSWLDTTPAIGFLRRRMLSRFKVVLCRLRPIDGR